MSLSWICRRGTSWYVRRAGMVVRVDVVARALESVYGVPAREVKAGRRVVLTEPAGQKLTHGYVDEVASGSDLTVICGRYGGGDGGGLGGIATEGGSPGGVLF